MTYEEIRELWNERDRIQNEKNSKLHEDIGKFYDGEKVDNDSKEFQQFLEFDKKYCKDLKPYRTN